jgi:hypothetical protein
MRLIGFNRLTIRQDYRIRLSSPRPGGTHCRKPRRSGRAKRKPPEESPCKRRIERVLVQREMEFGLGSLAGNDGTTGFALGGRC